LRAAGFRAGAFAGTAFLPALRCGFSGATGGFFRPGDRFDAPDPGVASGGVTTASYAPLSTLLTAAADVPDEGVAW